MNRWLLLPFFFLVIGLGAPAQSHPTQDTPHVIKLEGSWQGTLGQGAVKLRLLLTITKSSAETYSGILDSLDQNASLPIDRIALNGATPEVGVRLEVQVVGGVYEGVLSQDGSTLTGKWIQNGITQPLSFTRVNPSATPDKPATKSPSAVRPLAIDAPIDVAVPMPPTAFRAEGKMNVVYEVHITNFYRQEWTLTQLEILDGDEKLLAHYEGAALAGLLARPGIPKPSGLDALRLGPGLRAIVFVWLTFPSPAEVPATLSQRISVKAGDPPVEFTVTCARISVSHDVLVIGPPLRGAQWLAANGPSNTSGHRRAMVPTGGNVHLAERFAIDWVQLRDTGGTFSGDQLDNKSYRAFGSEVIAVADGVVSGLKDGIPENVPGEDSRAVPITLETVGGNYLILNLGNNRYAFYAHLQPGSLRVQLGDRVRRGQVLALLGNTGNSTEPHLHFHLCNANSPLESEGLPYAFESFEVQGRGWDWKPAGTATTPEKRKLELPAENEVVRFSPQR